jgi:hypothetical protein
MACPDRFQQDPTSWHNAPVQDDISFRSGVLNGIEANGKIVLSVKARRFNT